MKKNIPVRSGKATVTISKTQKQVNCTAENVLALVEKSIWVTTTDEGKYVLPVRHLVVPTCLHSPRDSEPLTVAASVTFSFHQTIQPPAHFPHKNLLLFCELSSSEVILWVSQDQRLSLYKPPSNMNQSNAQSKLHPFTRPTKTYGGSRDFQ